MILEILDDSGHPIRLVASRIVIREATTMTPVVVAADFAERGILAAKADDADFQKMLKVTGVNESVLVTTLDKDQLFQPKIS